MGFWSSLFCCFGKRVDTEDIVEMLEEHGIEKVGAVHGIKDMSWKDATSCNTTAILIGKIIQGELSEIKEPTASFAHIREGLQANMAVIVCLKPNHWFTAIPEGPTTITMLQSYQDLYTVREWLAARNSGVMNKDSFYRDVEAILTSGAPESAVRLFARNSSDAGTITTDFGAKASIETMYRVGSFKWKKV